MSTIYIKILQYKVSTINKYVTKKDGIIKQLNKTY
jgi:hypothetical protein